MGPEPDRDCWDWVEPAGEKGDCPWLAAPPCSPWLLLLLLLEEPPPTLTAEPRPASVPVGRSSIEPDRSWKGRKDFHTMLLHVKSETGVPRVFLPMLGSVRGADDQAAWPSVRWLLVWVNAISAATHKAFVSQHAAVSAHPLCQPASLSPGVIFPRSTPGTRFPLSLPLSFSPVGPLPVSANRVTWQRELSDVMRCLDQSGGLCSHATDPLPPTHTHPSISEKHGAVTPRRRPGTLSGSGSEPSWSEERGSNRRVDT
ncbi:hypothetical protein EYF80_037242 [Liparis tanakae]|uniref:Uncharacterized protein n=1 Tax=Liparis tanakae TaxID=230148 RepID=A0A4Z2GHC0_9TELE|nr:hypothetical protein EYF80_037242 [Liparis tanakae]